MAERFGGALSRSHRAAIALEIVQRGQALEPAGFGSCIGCGQPLDEREMFHGGECDSCKVAYADDDVEGHN